MSVKYRNLFKSAYAVGKLMVREHNNILGRYVIIHIWAGLDLKLCKFISDIIDSRYTSKYK